MSIRPQSAMQNSFAAGELSPSLYGRVDLDKYHIGLQTCRNALVDYRGGVTRRPGTRFVGLARDSTKKIRLIPFTFSTVQSYVLVFGDQTMRVIRNGGLVTEPTIAVGHSGTTVTATAHGLSTGDWVVATDFVHPLSVTRIDANSFTLQDLFGAGTVTSASTTVARVFTLATPWTAADVPLLKYTQSFDTMTLTHPSYQSRNLTRSQHWVWTLSLIDPAASLASPTVTSVIQAVSGGIPFGTPNTTCYGYRVTAVSSTGEESNPSSIFLIFGYNIQTISATNLISWNAVTGAASYNVYSGIPGQNVTLDASTTCGYIGNTPGLSFADTDITPDFTKTPPKHQNPFASSNFPGLATYFDQRRTFAASASSPQTLWMSRPGQFNNFDTSTPANDGDALTLTLSTVQSAAIRALLPMPDGLLVFTQSGVYKVSGGGQNTGIKVSNALARAQNYIGSSDVPPIPVNFEVIFVQEKGSIIRALAYNFYTSTYEPADLTLLSNHLFAPRTIIEWAYAEHPYKIVWCVRDDGQLLSLTYLKDQKIQGWARHDTNGTVESITSIPESGTDGLYMVVRRLINGTWYRFIEEMQRGDIAKGVEFGWFLDAALDYGNITPNAGLSFGAPTGSTTATADAAVFASGDIGKVIRAARGQATVTGFTSSTVVSITWDRNPTDLIQPGPTVRPQASGAWTMAAKVTSLSGLNHLNNAQVSYLADGVPGTGTVSSTGTLTIGTASSRIIVGLPYQTQCQTLDLEPSGQSVQGKRKRVVSLVAKVENTGSLKWGRSFDELTPWIDVYGDKLVNLVMTGDQPLGVDQFYDYGGRVCWQQDLPLPMTILSLVPELSVGD